MLECNVLKDNDGSSRDGDSDEADTRSRGQSVPVQTGMRKGGTGGSLKGCVVAGKVATREDEGGGVVWRRGRGEGLYVGMRTKCIRDLERR